jgi:hypothetical protein
MPLYAIYEMWARRRLADWRSWLALVAAAILSLLVTLPFMTPYIALRGLGQRPRGVEEVSWFSADVHGYLTADASLHAWGWLQTFPHPEGHVFPGAMPVVLSMLGVWTAIRTCGRSVRPATAAPSTTTRAGRISRWVMRAALLIGALHAVAAIGILTTGDRMFEVGPIELRLFSLVRPILITAVAGAVVLALSARARRLVGCIWRYPVVFAVAAAGLAFWMSLGPVIRVHGDPLRDGALYAWFYNHVPGFNGLRVPARFAMIVAFFLSVGCGTGAALLAWMRKSPVFVAVCAILVTESAMMPIPRNGLSVFEGLMLPPASVTTGPTALTRMIDTLPRDAVLLELPFGEISWEIRYQYLSIFHWRRMVNGYSGDFPARYIRQRATLEGLPEEGTDAAWATIRASGATHIVVHGEAFGEERARLMREWLQSRGARFVAAVPPAHIYALP